MQPIAQAVASGLVLGALWGGLEAAFYFLRPWFAFWVRLRQRPPLDVGDLSSVVLLGGLHYGVLAALGATAVTVALLPVLRRKPMPLLAPRLVVGAALFVNLYWHTKQLWAFSWGLPFTHPKRLALTVAWLVVAAVGARLLVREQGPLRAPSGRAGLVAALVLSVAAVWALPRELTRQAGPGTAPEGAPNVVFVVVDALRQDRLGCYGYERRPDISPRADALAEEGVVYEKAIVQAPFTWTSFGSFLTGKYPREHGLIKMWPDQKLDTHRNRTIAQALQEAGYATGAFLTGTLSNDTGLLNGFDTYFETIVGHEAVNRHSKWSVVRSRMLFWILLNKTRQALDVRLVNTEALGWIRSHADRPFFALVHYYSTHTPYDPPPPHDALDADYDGYFHPFRQKHGQWIMQQQQRGRCQHDEQFTWSCEHFDPVRDVEHVNALYDGGVAFADEMLGDLLDELEALGIADETLVVYSSDHGEELYDHGLFEHDWMFQTNLDVPLVVRYPGRAHAGARVPWPVELRDVPATILDVAGVGTLLDPDNGVTETPGRSLLPDAAGVDPGLPEHDVFAENVRYLALREDRYKLVQNRFDRSSLRVFDLWEDPGEHHPLDLDDPEHAVAIAAARGRLENFDERMPEVQAGSGGLDPDRARQLAQMGYTAGMDEEAQKAAMAGSDAVRELLGTSQFLGSNEILEEDIYTRPYQWPPGLNGLGPSSETAGPPDAGDAEAEGGTR